MLQVQNYKLNKYSYGRAVLLEVVGVYEKKSPPGRGLGKPERWSLRWSSIVGIGTEIGVGIGAGTRAETRMSVIVLSPYSTSPVE